MSSEKLLPENIEFETPFLENKQLSRSVRKWKVVAMLSVIIAVVSVVVMGFMVGFSHNPTMVNDFVHWTVEMGPVAPKVLPNVERLNKGKPVLPIHSHNDYWREHPLFDALHLAIKSVEADVWSLSDEDDVLYVGHRRISLTRWNNLQTLYLGPLEKLLDSNNSTDGVFDSDPSQTLYLYIDVKNNPAVVFSKLQRLLKPLQEKGYLTTYSPADQKWTHGAITVIVSGEVPVREVCDMQVRNVFIDAPLEDFDKLISQQKEFNNTEELSSLSLMSSSSLYKVTNSKGMTKGGLTSEEKLLVKKAVDRAHSFGIGARIWETPSWPIEQRNNVWNDLLEAGIDMINADDLKGAAML